MDRMQQAEQLFKQAINCGPAEREAFLTEHCGSDVALRTELDSLLYHHGASSDFLERPAVFPAVTPHELKAALAIAPSPPVPETIGPYRIHGILGRGGMGIVYRAEQENPKRVVALKVIKQDVTSSSMLRRFEYEAQVLGRLQHPGIAQIFEAGTAEVDGGRQPFFALELIEGQPLTDYANRKAFGARQRLELLARVCDAVQHAHQQGVIHRDLKPGNILVDHAGQPKILDFGVARATDADLQTTTARTDVGQLLGTIAYMSPEQIQGNPDQLDTRSDVYSLGVVGFELLTGRLPHDLRGKAVPEAARTITEENPERLSSSHRVFRGDIETIIGKALEKEKDRRYQSASDLAADIRRYLSDQPITARPVTTIYQLRKFARRNKTLVCGVLVALALLCGGLIHVTLERNRAVSAERLAEQRRREAERQTAIAQAVNDFLNDDLLAAASPEKLGRDVTMRQVLDHAAEAIEGRFDDQPLVEAAIRATVGETLYTLGEYDRAAPHLERALELRRAELGQQHRATLASTCDLGVVYGRLGRWDEAETLYVEALEGRRRLLGEDDPDTLRSMNNLATLYFHQDRFDEAEPLLVKAMEAACRTLGENHLTTLQPMNNLANLYARQRRFDEAEPLMVKTLAAKRRLLGEEHPGTLVTMNNLANVYCDEGRYDEAEPLYAKTLEIRRRVLGEEHPRTLNTIGNLGRVYLKLGRYQEAEPLCVQAVEKLRHQLGKDHPRTLLQSANLAALYNAQGRHEEAERLYTETLEACRRVLGEGHAETLSNLLGLVRSLIALGQLEEAEPLAIECHERHIAVYGPDHDGTRMASELLVELYDACDQPEQAAEWRAKLPTTQPAEPVPSP
jgi:serine/threonine protein kinase/Flp pilus assembly protein TadD